MACQEINPIGDRDGNGKADWDDLLTELGPLYSGRHGTTGGRQRLAFLWRNDRVELSDLGELKGIQREEVEGTTARTFPRNPITAYVKSKHLGVDFRLITVHLYWTSDEARYREAQTLNRWLQDHLETEFDKDVLLIGDCNTKPMGAGESEVSLTINNLEAGGRFTCVSKGHHEYTTPQSEERYDHAFLSSDLLTEEFVSGSWDVRREVADTYTAEYQRDISNHVPVTLRIRDTDNDEEAAGDLGE